MFTLFTWITQHVFWTAVALYWIFSAAVSSLPAPASNSGAGYLWLYRFLHTLAGNVTTAFSWAARYRAGASRGRIPGALLGLIVVLPLALFASACGLRYTIHPGAVDAVDSASYDALLSAQAVIDQARTDSQNGLLPGPARAPLEALIAAYNVAHTAWLTYRSAVAANAPADVYLNQLNQNITDLINAIRAFNKEAQP